MKIEKWLQRNTSELKGKTVAVSGSTGGIGRPLCAYLAQLGADLILMDRNTEKSRNLADQLKATYPSLTVSCLHLDLEDIPSVKQAAASLESQLPDVLILNAGAYYIPRHTCSTGLDNIFQINFASPYYLVTRLKPALQQKGGKVVAVGSIAHNYSKMNPNDIDFSGEHRCSKAYGNAKRFLMFSLWELYSCEPGLSIVHPGITLTNITAHYPKWIFAIIKHPMKVIFMPPKIACLSILRGIFAQPRKYCWIGPGAFDIWGLPRERKLRTCSADESARIKKHADLLCKSMD